MIDHDLGCQLPPAFGIASIMVYRDLTSGQSVAALLLVNAATVCCTVLAWTVLSCTVLSCTAGKGNDDPEPNGDGDGDPGDGDGDVGDGDGDLIVPCVGAECPEESECGDGILAEDEVCDDGNEDDHDGCASDCLDVEQSFTCPIPGQACRPFVRCGDGLVTLPEQCDDGGTENDDGCSAQCRIELNTVCSGEPSVCLPTDCGNGTKEGSEGCDDGNNLPGDGCGIHCQVEPSCSDDGCTSECGDGLVLDEECDDGNTVDGDGCSSGCTIELGSMCTATHCETVAEQCVVKVPVIYRDFNESHPDMQNTNVSCEGLATGAISTTLGQDGKPVFVGSPSTTAAPCISQFSDWYNQVENTNTAIVGEITLFESTGGVFVNRYQDDGSRFISDLGTPLDGQPFFFPLDHHPNALTQPGAYGFLATVNNTYSEIGGAATWTPESHFTGFEIPHNFHFTSEVKYWFRYDADETASLEFLGDDDVWVFINGRLVIDLGGLHAPESAAVTVSSATASSLGLMDGKVYPIHIFHAERKRDGSSFKLTLDGLTMGRSECFSVCGDEIIGPDEECDDGVNDGGYNQCQPGCVLGGFCGDGIVQAEEECDFKDSDAHPNCSTSCRIVSVR